MSSVILQGALDLYELGFEQVGQIHTGNVFLDGDICRLGGYENTVFGYKTRLTTLLHDYREAMDLIMFGKEWNIHMYMISSRHVW